MAEFTTILDGLEVMMRLGIYPHEMAPQRVVVSVEMTVVYPGPLGEDAIGERVRGHANPNEAPPRTTEQARAMAPPR